MEIYKNVLQEIEKAVYTINYVNLEFRFVSKDILWVVVKEIFKRIKKTNEILKNELISYLNKAILELKNIQHYPIIENEIINDINRTIKLINNYLNAEYEKIAEGYILETITKLEYFIIDLENLKIIKKNIHQIFGDLKNLMEEK